MIKLTFLQKTKTRIFTSVAIFLFSISILSAQSWDEKIKLLASDGFDDDVFGYSVSISGDYAIIGSYGDDDIGDESGSAYIFKYDSVTWTEEAKLTATDGAAWDYFGYSVSISGDYAIIGAYGDDDEGDESGSAYIFKRNGTVWTEEAKLSAADGAAWDYFGWSVSISGDQAIIGAYGNDENGDESGSAYIFKTDGIVWTEEVKITAADGVAWGYFGLSVSISGDYAIIGSPGDDDNGLESGSAYVFNYNSLVWIEEEKLAAADGAAWDYFGWSVSISGDQAIIGAYGDDDNGDESGSAYIFKTDGIVWTEEVKITASDGTEGDIFGNSVSITENYAIVGAPWDNDNGLESGSAYGFRYDCIGWTEKNKLTAADGAESDYFGLCVAISGEKAIIGAPLNDDTGLDSGSAYIFEYTPFTQTVFLDLKVFLKGPYNATDMNTDLNDLGYLPLSQPYDSVYYQQGNPGWYYTGYENVNSIPNSDVVDWVMVELRDACDLSSAQNSTAIDQGQQAAFLLKDGSIVGLDGSSMLQFSDITIQDSLFVVIWHRNHVPTLSKNPLIDYLGVYQFDFSNDINAQVCDIYCSSQIEVSPGIYAMNASDGNADNVVDVADINRCFDNWGISPYSPWDYNMDGCVLSQDIIETQLYMLNAPPATISQDQLTFRFANIQILPGIPEKVQFDIEVKADTPGTFPHILQVLLDYDTLGFGSNIAYNINFSVEYLEIDFDPPFPPYAIPRIVNSSSNRLAIGCFQDAYPNIDSIPTIFTGLVQIQMEVIDPNFITGIEFMEKFMNGGQCKADTETQWFKEYYSDPNLYEGDIFCIDTKVFLEGPFNGTDMYTDLNLSSKIPLVNPYGTSPWGYPGNDSVLSVPNPNVVDWILFELRNADSASVASQETTIDKKALFLLDNGSVVGPDGHIKPLFCSNITKHPFAVIKHRNHLAGMSAVPLTKTGDEYTYDFSTGADQVFGSSLGHKEIGSGIWGLISGDANSDGIITHHDKDDFWDLQAGEKGYLEADHNMNVNADNIDKNDFWWFNLNNKTQVPGENSPPCQPSDPQPHDIASEIAIDTSLSWRCSDPDEQDLDYTVYFGASADPPVVESNHPDTTYNPGVLNYNTTYYWKIIAVDIFGDSTSGPIWQFTTTNQPPNQPSDPSPENGAINISIDTTISWFCSDPDGDPLTYNIYFGTDPIPSLVVENHHDTNYNPGILELDTDYYWKIVAIDNYGDSTVGSIWTFSTIYQSWSCGMPITITHTEGATAPVTKTITYGTVVSDLTGNDKCWITQNLGADQQAITVDDTTVASAGWYWQFNRQQGYMHNGTIRTPNTPWDGTINESSDWQAINDPCSLLLGEGWRIPTNAELETADYNGGWDNRDDAFASVLKLHAAGYLSYNAGSLSHIGEYGYVWNNQQQSDLQSDALSFRSSYCQMINYNKSHGFSVRCLKD